MSAKNKAETGKNWLQTIIDEIIDLHRKLEDADTQFGNNQQVREQYDEAMTKVKEAQESINRFAEVFNKEHAFSGHDV